MRTYSGHTSARASNELYRRNLAKGQTGLSIAFDLPTQTGYDSDHPLARGEVGKVGVPICHIEDMEVLLEGIPLDRMNTSMTINATAPWLLALYVAVAERRGIRRGDLQGTTQNDILKEYLSRGTYIFPPEPSLRLTCDVVAFAAREMPKWNPVNVCSYHLQEAGATPAQEIAFALANAIAILDRVRASGQVPQEEFPQVVGRISFFVNAGVRFIEEMCKMRAFTELWDEICRERYGVADERLRRFRYGVQVNSLGLTEVQPENNVQRIVLETLGVVLSKRARARSIQLPAWNEALGLPRPWDQQWSLRIQQVIAYETDLLEYEDLFDGSYEVARKVGEILAAARAEMQRVAEIGGPAGALGAIEYMKQALVASNARRLRRIETGEQIVVGVNRFTETEPSPLTQAGAEPILRVDPRAEREQIERLEAFRRRRNRSEVEQALRGLRQALERGENVMPASIACAHAGVTTGEWADVLRSVFGEYQAPTGVAVGAGGSLPPSADRARERLAALERSLGRKLRFLVGKPGLDGHSNGAEQIALLARDLGFEVIYQGIRQTPEELARVAADEDVDVVGLSILSGSHRELVPETIRRIRERRGEDVPVVVGGIIPEEDRPDLLRAGVRRIYTPKDFALGGILADLVELLHETYLPASSSAG
jgi:(2R)-ethylmalonyl-CoA mutase